MQDRAHGRPGRNTTVRVTRPQAITLAVAITFAFAGALTVVADWNPSGGIVVGLTVLILSVIAIATTVLCALVHHRTAEASGHFERGQGVGYARGYKVGRREARPVVVVAFCPHCGEQLGRKAS